MASRRGQSLPSSRAGSDDEDDTQSQGSSSQEWSVEGDASEEAVSADDHELTEQMDKLLEKRSSTRETALATISKLLLRHPSGSLLADRSVTLVDALKRVMRKDSATELRCCGEVMALVFIGIGPDQEAVFQEVFGTMQGLVRDSKSEAVQASFVRAISMGCFISATEVETTCATMTFLEEVFSRSYGHLPTSEAISGWGLLASTAPIKFLRDSLPKIVRQLTKHLNHEHLEVRTVSGETIALIHELFDEGNALFTEDELEELTERLDALSAESSKQRAKKDRSKQRSVFRDVIRSLRDGETPSESLKFKTETVKFDDWSKLRQLECLRACLGASLNAHFQLNPVIRAIFDLGAVKLERRTPKLTAAEKRAFLSPNSEASRYRSRWLDSRRRAKAGMNAPFSSDND